MRAPIPASSHVFDNDNRTDGAPDYSVITVDRVWHPEPWLFYFVILGWYNRGAEYTNIPLWRMNGAGPNDTKVPIILAPGIFSNRFGMDYNLDGEIYSLARFLANRGRDVWIIEFEQSLEYSSKSFYDYCEQRGFTWLSWYWDYLTTSDPDRYAALDAQWVALGNGEVANQIVSVGDIFTTTVDDLILEDLPCIIASIIHYTGQPRVQLFGHSLGAIVEFGFCATEYIPTGRYPAVFRWDEPPWNLPPNSVISVTCVALFTRLTNVPPDLQALYDSGNINLAWTYRAKLPRYYRYLNQFPLHCPVKLQGIIDTALLRHLGDAIEEHDMPFFKNLNPPYPLYKTLFEGGSITLRAGIASQKTVTGHLVNTPMTFIYDGNGYDILGSYSNLVPLVNDLIGYKCIKPFYQFCHSQSAHVELVAGYIFEDGDPGWPPHLQYDYGGTWHYIWYDLMRMLPPNSFNAYCSSLVCAAAPFVSWVNNKDASYYEIWARPGSGSFVKKVGPINAVNGGSDVPGLAAGTWHIKVRAISISGEYQDSSGYNTVGGVDDPAKFIIITKE